MTPLNPRRQRQLDHWLQWLPTHTEYLLDAIKTYFERQPWDRDALLPRLQQAFPKIKFKG